MTILRLKNHKDFTLQDYTRHKDFFGVMCELQFLRVLFQTCEPSLHNSVIELKSTSRNKI
jgi:hypothetical protein